MSKSIKEVLETLEEPYRSQALDNLDLEHCPGGWEQSNKKQLDAVNFAFLWRATKEGVRYWGDFHDELVSKRAMIEQLYRKKPAEWKVNGRGNYWRCDYGYVVIKSNNRIASYLNEYTSNSKCETLQEAKDWVEAQRDEMLNQYFTKL